MPKPTKPTLTPYTSQLPEIGDPSTWAARCQAFWTWVTGAGYTNMSESVTYMDDAADYVDGALTGTSQNVLDSLNAITGGTAVTIGANEIVWGSAQHRLTDNDGAGNANIRFGHEFAETTKAKIAGGSGVHLEAAVDGATSSFHIDLLSAGAAVGDTISSVKQLSLSAAGTFTWGGDTVWHAGNDGTGSGLDADKVDGLQASQFLRSDTDDATTALLSLSRGGGEQLRVGYGTGAARNSYISLYDGQTTRRGYLQALGDRIRIKHDGGAVFDILGSGDVRVDDDTVWHAGNVGAGSGLDADLLDGVQGSSFVRGDAVNNGSTNIYVNDADFTITDSTDAVANFFWRDHSANLLYLGSPNAEVRLRSKLWLTDGNFGGVDVGRGTVYVENSASDGDGAGLCFRTSSNPTTGLMFSVRSSGGALGLGVGQDNVRTSRSDIYVGTDNNGAGGNRVNHTGIAHADIGQYVFAAGVNASPGTTYAGSSLKPAGTDFVSAATLPGTWRALGDTDAASKATLFVRIA